MYIYQKQDTCFLTSYIFRLYTTKKDNSLRNKCLVVNMYIDIFVLDIQSLYNIYLIYDLYICVNIYIYTIYIYIYIYIYINTYTSHKTIYYICNMRTYYILHITYFINAHIQKTFFKS